METQTQSWADQNLFRYKRKAQKWIWRKKTVNNSEDFDEDVDKPLFDLELEREDKHWGNYQGNSQSRTPVHISLYNLKESNKNHN